MQHVPNDLHSASDGAQQVLSGLEHVDETDVTKTIDWPNLFRTLND